MQVTPIIHLAIDYQDFFLSHVPNYIREAFTTNARLFADRLMDAGVTTIWVMYGTDWKYGSSGADLYNEISPYGQNYNYTLHANIKAKANEPYFIKSDRPAISKLSTEPLEDILHKKQTEQLLISGLYTRFCVLETIKNATIKGFPTTAIYDQMMDSGWWDDRQNYGPAKQMEILSFGLPYENIKNLAFKTKEVVLDDILNAHQLRRPQSKSSESRFLSYPYYA